MAFGADKPFIMKIAKAVFPPNLHFAQARLAAQKIVSPFGEIVTRFLKHCPHNNLEITKSFTTVVIIEILLLV